MARKDVNMPVVEVNSVSKKYGKIQALEVFSMAIEEGEIVGLIGPNGAGKSTAIKCMTGQLESDSGSIEVLGRNPQTDPIGVRKTVGILPEREDPPSFLTGREYLDYISDVREKEIDSEKWIERLNLKGKMGKQTIELSKGERQKLMIIQAFFHEPSVTFIDEPLINLDPLIQEEVKKIFNETVEREGSVLLSTHSISLAEEVCDRVYFLKNGEATEVEEVENLKSRFLDAE